MKYTLNVVAILCFLTLSGCVHHTHHRHIVIDPEKAPTYELESRVTGLHHMNLHVPSGWHRTKPRQGSHEDHGTGTR